VDAPVVAAPVSGGQPPAAAPQATGPSMDQLRDISALEAIVVKDQGNLKAWVSLGNLYFDTHQHQKSIDAYARALALKPDDPNVVTDQGIMYLALDQYDQAIANFQRASRLDPSHLQSLFNLGIAYQHKGDAAKAASTFKQLIEKAPTSQQAADARQALQAAEAK
jgi:cytochrome c-type biogenesis protein CcmH/NrfG